MCLFGVFMNKKMMMGLASTFALAAAVGVFAFQGENNLATKVMATPSTYSAAFTGTTNALGALNGTLTSYSGTSASGNAFHYAASFTSATGTGSVNASVGSNSGIWGVVNNVSGTDAITLYIYFSMNGIKTVKLDHYYTGNEVSSVKFQTAPTGYNGTAFPGNGYTERETLSGSSLVWAADHTIPDSATNSYQTLEIQIVIPKGTVFGVSPTITWSC